MKLCIGLLYLLLGTTINIAAQTNQDTTQKKVFIPEKTGLASFLIIAITDTANTTEDFGRLFNKDYGELFLYSNQHALKTGRIMAFYYTSHQPFIFDAAVEVDKLPNGFTGKIKGKKIGGGDALVVHYQGPYNQVGVAYAAISKWLQENNKKALQQPFEVYLDDPGTVKDPAQLRTDVYQRLQ
ncbi:hypothetical protein A4D02_27515 [Niastella koreensis]|nr:GyrI-like domain-containing protein [Niastella koreensis]OQP50182.1 hypothetical protein A4D02_27515 [Niastella koreensis]